MARTKQHTRRSIGGRPPLSHAQCAARSRQDAWNPSTVPWAHLRSAAEAHTTLQIQGLAIMAAACAEPKDMSSHHMIQSNVSDQIAELLFGRGENYEDIYIHFIETELSKQRAESSAESSSSASSSSPALSSSVTSSPASSSPASSSIEKVWDLRLHMDSRISMLLNEAPSIADARMKWRPDFCTGDLSSIEYLFKHRHLHFILGGFGVASWTDSLEKLHYIVTRLPFSCLESLRSEAVSSSATSLSASISSTATANALHVYQSSSGDNSDYTIFHSINSHRSDAHSQSAQHHFCTMVVQVIDTNIARHINSSRILSHLLNRHGVNKDVGFVIGSFITPMKLMPPVYHLKRKSPSTSCIDDEQSSSKQPRTE